MDFSSSTFWTLCITTLVLSQIVYVVAASPLSASSLNQREGRIINGVEALQNNTKYQVSIRSRKTDEIIYGAGHLCGASLISNNVVLGAANCFLDYSSLNGSFLDDDYFMVTMGNVDRYEKDNNTLVFDIKKLVKYNEIFNVQTLENDLVLVMLNDSVPADHPTVKPVTLNGGPLNSGDLCKFSGWGQTEQNTIPSLLRTVDLPIISYDTCLSETANGAAMHLGMLCAGYIQGGIGACPTDAGSPLVCSDLQAGIASWSSGCAQAKKPAVFTDVAFYKDWILSKVAEYKGTLPTFVGTIIGGGGSTGGSNSTTGGESTTVSPGSTTTSGNGNGTTGNGGNSTTGGDDGGGDGAMSTYNNSIILAISMVIFNVILNKL